MILRILLLICITANAFGQIFLDAELLTHNETKVQTKILAHKRDDYSKYSFLEVYDSVRGAKKIYPKDIAGYKTKDKEYKSFTLQDTIQKKSWDFFAEVIEKGDCEILFFACLLDNLRGGYAFRLQREKYYHLLVNDMIMDLSPRHYLNYIFHDEQVFCDYFAWYFRKCPLVARKIQHGYYNISLFTDMVKDYNDCIPPPSNHLIKLHK